MDNSRYIRFNISNSFEEYENWNSTSQISINLLNKTNALVYFSNNSGFICSSECSLMLNPMNYSFVLDNFNLTEGVSRLYSPITISSSSDRCSSVKRSCS